MWNWKVRSIRSLKSPSLQSYTVTHELFVIDNNNDKGCPQHNVDEDLEVQTTRETDFTGNQERIDLGKR